MGALNWRKYGVYVLLALPVLGLAGIAVAAKHQDASQQSGDPVADAARKARGTGLGLAVVQKIILQHGGLIEARNHPSGGAVFIVTLPARRAQASDAVELKKDVISI